MAKKKIKYVGNRKRTHNSKMQTGLSKNSIKGLKIDDTKEDEEDYFGYSTIERWNNRVKKLQLQHKNRRRKGAAIPGAGRKSLYKYAIVSPADGAIIRILDNTTQLENYTNRVSIRDKVILFEKYKIPTSTKPSINGYIIVRFTAKEIMGLSIEELDDFIHDKARGWLVINQMHRIRENIKALDDETLIKLENYLRKIEKL